jgi:hypothetical protein
MTCLCDHLCDNSRTADKIDALPQQIAENFTEITTCNVSFYKLFGFYNFQLV